MKNFEWRGVGRGELAALLSAAKRVSSAALGDATIYRLDGEGHETLAIALPDGQAVIVERAAPPAKRRRRAEGKGLTPASR